MGRCLPRNRRRGFTLIELVTAMMVSVLLIGTAFSTFWTATHAWEKAKRRTEMFRLLQGAAELITRQLRAMQPPFFEENSVCFAVDDGDEEGDYDSIAFLSNANPRVPSDLDLSDLCEVEFYIDTGEREVAEDETVIAGTPGEGGLWMRIDPTPDDDPLGGGYLVQIGGQIVSFDLRFFDGTEWLDEWYYDTEAPVAVEFTLTVADSDGLENPMTLTRLVVIPMAERINSQTTSWTTGEEEAATTEESGGSGTESGGEGAASGSGGLPSSASPLR